MDFKEVTEQLKAAIQKAVDVSLADFTMEGISEDGLVFAKKQAVHLVRALEHFGLKYGANIGAIFDAQGHFQKVVLHLPAWTVEDAENPDELQQRKGFLTNILTKMVFAVVKCQLIDIRLRELRASAKRTHRPIPAHRGR